MVKRLRVFAGPNGSGKSSIIKKILNTEVQNGIKLDFGIYINADDIAVDLQNGGCDFTKYSINFSRSEFLQIVLNSGLINSDFSEQRFLSCFQIDGTILSLLQQKIVSNEDKIHERISQIIADYLRKKLLSEGKKFSFETVFSHYGKVEFIKQAKDAGYKVYLYFVSTEHPTINVYRVKVVRVGENGHDVDKEKIISRYYRSMDLLYDAAQSCYQSYFFDNSVQGSEHTMFAHFKVNAEGEKEWGKMEEKAYPNWFKKYYSNKINQNK